MARTHSKFWAPCLLFLLILSNVLQSSIGRVVVSPDGEDSDACGDTVNPCATIPQAMERSSSGGSILLLPGIYPPFFATKSLSFTGSGRDSTHIDCSLTQADVGIQSFTELRLTALSINHCTLALQLSASTAVGLPTTVFITEVMFSNNTRSLDLNVQSNVAVTACSFEGGGDGRVMSLGVIYAKAIQFSSVHVSAFRGGAKSGLLDAVGRSSIGFRDVTIADSVLTASTSMMRLTSDRLQVEEFIVDGLEMVGEIDPLHYLAIFDVHESTEVTLGSMTAVYLGRIHSPVPFRLFREHLSVEFNFFSYVTVEQCELVVDGPFFATEQDLSQLIITNSSFAVLRPPVLSASLISDALVHGSFFLRNSSASTGGSVLEASAIDSLSLTNCTFTGIAAYEGPATITSSLLAFTECGTPPGHSIPLPLVSTSGPVSGLIANGLRHCTFRASDSRLVSLAFSGCTHNFAAA